MSRREQLIRVFEIDRQIRAGLYPHPDALAQELDVKPRVIFNDRRYLVDQWRAPLKFHRQRGGWYYTDKTFVLPTVMVTQGDLLAFFLSVEVAHHYLGTALEAPLRSAVEKLAHTLSDKVQVDLGRLRSHYTFATPAAALAKAETMLGLDGAIDARQAVSIRYFTASRGVHTERTVHPHHLHHNEGDWHLIAYDQMRQRLTVFNVGRIEEWRLLPQHFTREPDFDPKTWLQAMFQSERAQEIVPIVIRFDEYQARWIRERRYHDT